MQVYVGDIKLDTGSHKTVPLHISLDPVEFGGQEVQFDQPFEGEAEIWNTGDRLLVKASLSGEATADCSRCLTRFTLPLDIDFDEEFMEGEVTTEVADADEGRSLSSYEGDHIDLTDPLRENALLELPMKPLCKATCAGLCPTCGTNLNEGPCDCGEHKPVDPRLAALQELLRKPDSNQ